MAAVRSKSPTTRLLIADSAELVRRGLRDVLSGDPDFAIVGELTRPQEVVEACRERSPDVVLIGLHDATASSSAVRQRRVLRELLTGTQGVRVVALVEGHAVDDMLELARCGVRGILLQDAPAAAVRSAVRDVVWFGASVDPRLIGPLFDWLAAHAASPEADAASGAPAQRALARLSHRERDVLQALASGYRNKGIAAELGISVGTVKTHLRHIFRKLGVADRTAAALAAHRAQPRERMAA